MKNLAVYFRPFKAFEQHVPAQRVDRVRQSLQRRLSDQVDEVFCRACAENDVRTAASLYALMEDLNTRRQQQHGLERRISDQALAKAREALDHCRARGQPDNKAPSTAG